MRLHLEPAAGHTDRILDALLAVDHVAAGNDMDDLPVVGNGYGPGRIDHTGDVVLADLPVGAGHRDHAPAVLAEHVGARQPDEGSLDLVSAHPLGGVDRVRDAAHGLLHVDHHAAAEAV